MKVVTEWVPVPERLPEIPKGEQKVYVLVAVAGASHAHMASFFFDKHGLPIWDNHIYGHTLTTPTYWAYLPTSPDQLESCQKCDDGVDFFCRCDGEPVYFVCDVCRGTGFQAKEK